MHRIASATVAVAPSPHAGVYRFRHRIDGCRAYYRIDAAGRLAGTELVRPGMSEAQVVADLARAQWGDEVERRTLHLVREPVDAPAPATTGDDGASACRSRPLSPALLARIVRARLAAPRAALPPT